MNAGISRCWRYSRSITMPSVRAFSMASSTLLPVPASAESKTHSADLLVPRSGCASAPRSRRPGRLLEVDRGRQLLVVDVDQLGGVAGLGRGPRDDHGDGLAGEGDPVGGQRRVRRRDLVGGDRPGVDAGALAVAEVGAGEHGDDVGGRRRGAGVDVGDPRVGEGAAHHREVQHPGGLEVVGPAGASGDQALVLLAAALLADLGGRAVLGGGHDVASALSSWVAGRRRSARPGRCCGSRCSGRGCPRGRAGSPPRWASGCWLSRSTLCMIIPGVQKPHCRPWHSRNASCTGCSSRPGRGPRWWSPRRRRPARRARCRTSRWCRRGARCTRRSCWCRSR